MQNHCISVGLFIALQHKSESLSESRFHLKLNNTMHNHCLGEGFFIAYQHKTESFSGSKTFYSLTTQDRNNVYE